MTAESVAPDNASIAPLPAARLEPGRPSALRKAEWIIFAFLVYAVALSFLWPAPRGLSSRLLWVNSAVMLGYAALIAVDFLKPRLAFSVARDWLPLAFILLAYREMGWFALPHESHALEFRWVVWDEELLRHGGRAMVEFFGPVLPSILEIAYALVYTLAPFSVAALYLYRRRDLVDRFQVVVLLSVLLCYAQFPFWPSDPPRVFFFGEDLPSYDTIFRHLNLWMLGNYGIHTSVFPSAHVAGALSAAFGMRLVAPERKQLWRFLFVMAALIAAATVYGRYHYVADASAGAIIATLVAFFAVAVPASREIESHSAAGQRDFVAAIRRHAV